MNRQIRCGAMLLGIGVLFTGCNDSDPKSKPLDGEPVTLKVLMQDEQRSFYNVYGRLFMAKYPHIDLQAVSTMGMFSGAGNVQQQMEALVQREQPDVLMLNPYYYNWFAPKGQLSNLDTWIKQERYELDGMLPTVVNTLRDWGGGSLYGLAPYYAGEAVYYNKSLFAKYGVPLPKDAMSWEELFILAQRFPVSVNDAERVYGLSFDFSGTNVFSYVEKVGSYKGLRYVDADGKSMSIASEPWKTLAQQMVDLIQTGTVYTKASDRTVYNPMVDPFIKGKVAMAIQSSGALEQMRWARGVSGEQLPDWDVVSMPVDPQHPEAAASIKLQHIFSVNEQSAQRETAWEFVKYINSEDYAAVVARSELELSFLPVRDVQRYVPADRFRAAAFRPTQGKVDTSITDLPQGLGQLNSSANTALQAVLNGEQTVEEALSRIQEEGERLLFQSKQAE